MRKTRFVFLFGLVLVCRVGLASVESVRKIPFEIERNKVILPVRINDSRPLRIILDSGMPGQGVVLFKKELGEELGLAGEAGYQIRGAGRGRPSTAVRAECRKLTVGDEHFSDQPVIILQNDTMSGFPTDGVVGNTIFGSHAVRFDFENGFMALMEPGSFKPDSTWETLALTFNDHGIPFIRIAVSVSGEADLPLRVYIDSASSEALELLVRAEQKFVLPDNLETRHLGRGLSGDVSGRFGRVARLRLGGFLLKDVPTAFPRAEIRSRQPGADGIVCNRALLRFHAVFDFAESKLHLKPNSRFGEPFE